MYAVLPTFILNLGSFLTYGCIMPCIMYNPKLYMLALRKFYPSAMNVCQGLSLWVRLFQIILIPITAVFCEELIWRGYIPTQMELRGYRFWLATLLSSLSFAAIPGVLLPDKLLVTFLWGSSPRLTFSKNEISAR